MDRWIFDREQHKNLVFSFDLCCSHISLVLVLVFYWMQLQPPPTPNPLLSRKEQSLIERQRYSTLSNLLEILHSYIVHRSREYRTCWLTQAATWSSSSCSTSSTTSRRSA